MPKKKILVFSLAYFPRPVGGAEVALKEITARIPEIEFHILTHRFDQTLPRAEKIGDVYVHRIGDGSSYVAKMFFVLRAAFAARRLHAEHHFDAAWAMMSYMSLPLMLLRLIGIRLPYALSLQEGDPFEHVFKRPHIRIFAPLLRAGFKNASVIQTISTFLAGWAKRAGFPGEPIVIPNGVDTDAFAHTYPEPLINEVKDRLGKRMGDVFVVTTSRLVYKNALDVCIDAMKSLPENVHFQILGTGPLEEVLKLKTKKLKLDTRVHFLGHVEHDELPKYLKACDIFLRPSRSEGMGNSFVEAMAAGLPVIATQEGGLADFIFDIKQNPDTPKTAWVVQKDSADDIVRAVRDIMNHPEIVRGVVATARQMVGERFNWNLVASDMRAKLFTKILGA